METGTGFESLHGNWNDPHCLNEDWYGTSNLNGNCNGTFRINKTSAIRLLARLKIPSIKLVWSSNAKANVLDTGGGKTSSRISEIKFDAGYLD